MAALITSDFQIPNDIAAEIFKKAQTGSVLARLSGARPQKFGSQTTWVLTAPPKAEIVGEGAEKSPTPTTYAPKIIKPFKAQVTMRFSQEVQWADEDTQIGVLKDLAENAAIALGRALDLAAIHKINPLTGTTSSIITEGIIDTPLNATLVGRDVDGLIETAVGMLIAGGYTPTGIAMDPSLSFMLATAKDNDGRKLYPNMGYGQDVTNFAGMKAAVSDTVSGKNELPLGTADICGIVGQFDAFRWGVQRQIAAHLIEFGDPDGLGDLQRMNQIALRAEIVYGIGIMDKNAFVKLKDH